MKLGLRPLRLSRDDTHINFLGGTIWAMFGSGLLIALSLAIFLTQGLNFGIDFRGGILIELRTDGPADLANIREIAGGLGLGDVQVQNFGRPEDVLIRIEHQVGDAQAQLASIDLVQAALGERVLEYRRTEFVGPTVGAELIRSATMAVMLAISAILIYVWFRFEWQFGIGAVAALLHDIILTIGFFGLTQIEFNLASIAAVFTIAGYSINDTVVIYDRVRERARKYKAAAITDILNSALNATLSRTLLTSVTTLLALAAPIIMGGPVIRDFAMAMAWGVIVGTYSSIYIAAPMLRAIGYVPGGTRRGK